MSENSTTKLLLCSLLALETSNSVLKNSKSRILYKMTPLEFYFFLYRYFDYDSVLYLLYLLNSESLKKKDINIDILKGYLSEFQYYYYFFDFEYSQTTLYRYQNPNWKQINMKAIWALFILIAQ